MKTIWQALGILLAPLAFMVPKATPADLSALAQLLKEVYDPVIEDQQNLEAMTWKEFGDATDQLGGQGWIFETRMGGNQEGIAARDENELLPVAGSQRWKQGKVLWKLLYATFQITGPAIEAAKSNVTAFANAKTEEIEGLTRDFIKDLNRQTYGDGGGVMATVSETTAAGNTFFYVKDALYLRQNMIVDIWRTTTKQEDSKLITKLEPAANATFPQRVKATCAALANGVALADVVIREDVASVPVATRIGKEIEGIAKIADDGTAAATYLDISRTDYPLWKGHLFDNGGTLRNLTLDMLQAGEDAVVRATGKRPDWIRMNLGQRRKYFDLVAPDKRYMTGTIDGGYERLDFNGNQLTIDVDHPRNEITYLTKGAIKKYIMRKLGILDFDGQVLRQVAGYDKWIGYLGMYGNIGCKRPQATARTTDLVEPTEEVIWVG